MCVHGGRRREGGAGQWRIQADLIGEIMPLAHEHAYFKGGLKL